jgi:DNA polymerase-3 subunit epsilon
MQLTKPINYVDCEGSGLDPAKDRIVSLAIVQVHPDGTRVPFSWKFNPEVIMTDEVIAVHGITNEEVINYPKFKDHAEEIHQVLKDVDLAGYNVRGYDIQIIWEELYRAGIEWDVEALKVVDVCVLFKLMEPRDLTHAVLKFAPDHKFQAHSAMDDTKATLEVLKGMLLYYSHTPTPLPYDIPGLAEMSCVEKDGSRRLDLAGTVVLDKEGIARYTHKKMRGVAVENDLGYLEWILRSDFSQQTKIALKKLRDQIYRSSPCVEDDPQEEMSF